MRFLVILCVIVGGYLLFVRSKSAPVPAPSAPAAQAGHSPTQPSIIKAPIDRARKALEATEKRNADGF